MTLASMIMAGVLSATPVEIELYKIPAGKQMTCGTSTFMAYTFTEWKTLLLVDQDLKAKVAALARHAEIVAGYEKNAGDLQAMIESYRVTNRTLTSENERIHTKWIKADEALQKAKAGSIFRFIPLLAGGVLTVIGTTLLLVN